MRVSNFSSLSIKKLIVLQLYSLCYCIADKVIEKTQEIFRSVKNSRIIRWFDITFLLTNSTKNLIFYAWEVLEEKPGSFRNLAYYSLASLTPWLRGTPILDPSCFLTLRLSAWPLHKIQNVTKVKFKSLALVWYS